MRGVGSVELGVIVLALFMSLVCSPVAQAASGEPVFIGLSAEFGLKSSVSAQAVEMGIRVALEEINARGGVLGGRPLALETRDDRSVPARAIDNLVEFAKKKDLVAVFGARFSPVLLELLPMAHQQKMILLDPWASADGITEHEYKPNYAFRLSLKDSYAMPAMLKYASGKGWSPVGLLLPNTGWGRSNDKAAQAYLLSHPEITIARTRWYNWGDANYSDFLRDFREAGAKALVFVANDIEGAGVVNEIAKLPTEQRTPVISHWGVTGGRFFESAKDSLTKLQFRVVQTFSFFTAPKEARERFMALAKKLYNTDSWEKIAAPSGVGHAYDLTHLLALAIDKAGATDRERVRAALEELGPYKGLCGDFNRPFSPDRHDALGPESVFLATYRDDGVIVPAP